MLDALGGRGPHAVLFFTGKSGSTKTTHSKMVRLLTDPHARPVRSKPKELRDVYIAAIKSGMVVYNNLSSLPEWLSDVLCVVSEGSSDSRRELFTDDDESVIFARADHSRRDQQYRHARRSRGSDALCRVGSSA